jgi:uncharacterized membrane protein
MVDPVSSRTKTIVILAVAFTILYILISPLPEMDATRAPHVLFFLGLSFFCIAIAANLSMHLFQVQHREIELRSSLSFLCSRLC